MEVSLNWLRQYIDTVGLEPEAIGDILTSTGLEVEGMKMVESIPGGLHGLIVGKVVSCGKHENADKLSVTKVDVGQDELLQIVCGAPNVAEGQKVVVATVGTELHPTDGSDPFKIKKGKIRGEVSMGMICAEDEIGLGQGHDGIIVLPEDTPIGSPVRDYYGIETDYVYDIGLTPNRSDGTNHLGVATDLGAALKINHNYKGNINAPNVDAFKVDNNNGAIAVEVLNSEACPRYSGLVIKNLKIAESPDWLKKHLNAIGVRPINNVVDITNFVLHELGQPLHAFDLNEIKGNKIIVQTLAAKTKFLALDETERVLRDEDLMICDGEGNGMCIGGVFGGITSGVKDSTTAIFLESAHFDAEWIRRSSMAHNLRTDAAKVFEKGSDPNVTVYALKRAALLMQELAGGVISSEIVDIYPVVKTPVQIKVRYSRVNELIGVDISPSKVHEILEAMAMNILSHNDKDFTVEVPTNKSDVLREVDVIEEILRIYGFNNVPLPSRITTSLALSKNPDPNQITNNIGDLLAARGFHEMMALSLSESRYYTELEAVIPAEELVFINNTSNVHLDVMRPHMVFSGLEAILRNQNRQENDLRLFEFGRTYRKDGEAFEETSRLTIFMTGRRHAESWLADDKAELSFYTLKTEAQAVLNRLGIAGYQKASIIDSDIFAYGLHYHRGPKTLVDFGRLNSQLVKSMDIKGTVFYADFHWDNVLSALPKKRIAFKDLNKYPTMRRDLALVVDKSVKFSDIAAIATKTGKKLLSDINLFDVYMNDDQLGKGKKSYAVSFLFEDPSRTLKIKEVDKIMDKLIKNCESQLSAQVRR